MDRWVLSRLASVEVAADDALQRYDATMAARIVMEFVDEDVANTYVRQSRSRLWAKDNVFTDDTNAAFATLHEVLVVVTRLLAPFAPFVTDWMHRELTGSSVHLASYTRKDASADSSTALGMTDVRLEDAMATVRMLATLGRAAREQVGINVRQPLSRMVCVAPGVDQALLEELLPVLRAELNVKQVDFASSGDALVTLEAKPNFRALGKKFGKKTPLAAEAVKAFTGEHLRAFQSGAELALTVEGETHLLEPDDVTILSRASGSLVVEHQATLFAAIDPTLTPELEREGMARELISRVQRMRKDTGLAVSDRIELSIGGDVAVVEAAEAHREWIADEVLATHVAIGAERPRSTHMPERQQVDIDGVHAELALTRDE
jgi:isoleucyl-tRNA synthetase